MEGLKANMSKEKKKSDIRCVHLEFISFHKKNKNSHRYGPSHFFLLNSDPTSCLCAPLLCNKIRTGHSTFLLLITNVCHVNHQTCPHSYRMLVSEPKHNQPWKEWNIFYPEVLRLFHLFPGEKLFYWLSLVLHHISLIQLQPFQKQYLMNTLDYYVPQALMFNSGLLISKQQYYLWFQ